MALEVFYSQDILNALLALASAGELHGPEYHKALHDVALAFGLQPMALQRWQVIDSDLVGVENEAQEIRGIQNNLLRRR